MVNAIETAASLQTGSGNLVLESVLENQRRRWQAGQRPNVETYLQRFPNLDGDRNAMLDLIYNEVWLRQNLGESPRLGEYVERFPDLSADLELQFEVHEALDDQSASTGGSLQSSPAISQKSANTAAFPTIADYQVQGLLGQGGMGVVYKALHRPLNRVVALKMILAGPHASGEQLARFQTEVEAVARLQHPNIVQIHEVGQQDGYPYCVLEFVEGGNLAEKLAGRPLQAVEAARLMETLARAVHYAHRRGIVHRDLKPANVLLSADGTPKIADFGLAKRLEETDGPTRTQAILGTPSYMAPEQIHSTGETIGPECDVYALGAILYQMLTGRPPFQATSLLEALEQVRLQRPEPIRRIHPTVPRDLETIALKCLEKEPHKRYTTAQELADDLRRFLAGDPIIARPIGLLERTWLWCQRRERIRDAGAMMVFQGSVLTLGALLLLTLIALGIEMRQPIRRGEAIRELLLVLAVFHLPPVGLGLLTLQGRSFALWIGAALALFGLGVSAASLAGVVPVVELVDVGGLHENPEARLPLCAVLSIVSLLAFLACCTALIAQSTRRA